MDIISKIIQEIKEYSNIEYANHHAKFFKTAKGEYGEGDLFYGLRVPQVRQIAKKYYKEIKFDSLQELISNPYHEVRLLALIILVLKYEKANEIEQEFIYNFYLKNVQYINNWDLVDLSCYKTIGAYLFKKDQAQLWNLANTDHLWSQRIAVVSTYYFIKKDDYKMILELSEYFLNHKQDLMHKACGWMLREVGKRDINVLYEFLDKNYKLMPRTMLRYSIEKLSKEKRAIYMAK